MEEKWQSYVDRIIQEAQERGEFNLGEARGKRMDEDRAAQHAGERAMANKLLQNSGHAPPFLMKKREIDDVLAKERTRLLRYAQRRRRLLAAADEAPSDEQAAALRSRAEQDWGWAVAQFEAALPALHKEIELFNLMNPIPSMHRAKPRLAWEIERAERDAAGDG